MSMSADLPSTVLVCRLCNSLLRDPHTLPCLHSFCFECLHQLVSAQTRQAQQTLPCPVCSQVAAIPQQGASGFLPNAFLERMSAEYVSEVQRGIATGRVPLSPPPGAAAAPGQTPISPNAILAARAAGGPGSPFQFPGGPGSSSSTPPRGSHGSMSPARPSLTSTGQRPSSSSSSSSSADVIIQTARKLSMEMSMPTRGAGVERRMSTTPQDVVRVWECLQRRLANLQTASLRATYSLETVNMAEAAWHHRKQDLKRDIQRRSAQLQFYIKRQERLLLAALESRGTDDAFLSATDKARSDLRTNLKTLLHQTDVFKSVLDFATDSELVSLALLLLGSSSCQAAVALETPELAFVMPEDKTIEEMVAQDFGCLTSTLISHTIFSPEEDQEFADEDEDDEAFVTETIVLDAPGEGAVHQQHPSAQGTLQQLHVPQGTLHPQETLHPQGILQQLPPISPVMETTASYHTETRITAAVETQPTSQEPDDDEEEFVTDTFTIETPPTVASSTNAYGSTYSSKTSSTYSSTTGMPSTAYAQTSVGIAGTSSSSQQAAATTTTHITEETHTDIAYMDDEEEEEEEEEETEEDDEDEEVVVEETFELIDGKMQLVSKRLEPVKPPKEPKPKRKKLKSKPSTQKQSASKNEAPQSAPAISSAQSSAEQTLRGRATDVRRTANSSATGVSTTRQSATSQLSDSRQRDETASSQLLDSRQSNQETQKTDQPTQQGVSNDGAGIRWYSQQRASVPQSQHSSQSSQLSQSAQKVSKYEGQQQQQTGSQQGAGSQQQAGFQQSQQQSRQQQMTTTQTILHQQQGQTTTTQIRHQTPTQPLPPQTTTALHQKQPESLRATDQQTVHSSTSNTSHGVSDQLQPGTAESQRATLDKFQQLRESLRQQRKELLQNTTPFSLPVHPAMAHLEKRVHSLDRSSAQREHARSHSPASPKRRHGVMASLVHTPPRSSDSDDSVHSDTGVSIVSSESFPPSHLPVVKPQLPAAVGETSVLQTSITSPTDRASSRPVRRAISAATDKVSKMEYLRENWRRRKQMLIQNQAYFTAPTAEPEDDSGDLRTSSAAPATTPSPTASEEAQGAEGGLLVDASAPTTEPTAEVVVTSKDGHKSRIKQSIRSRLSNLKHALKKNGKAEEGQLQPRPEKDASALKTAAENRQSLFSQGILVAPKFVSAQARAGSAEREAYGQASTSISTGGGGLSGAPFSPPGPRSPQKSPKALSPEEAAEQRILLTVDTILQRKSNPTSPVHQRKENAPNVFGYQGHEIAGQGHDLSDLLVKTSQGQLPVQASMTEDSSPTSPSGAKPSMVVRPRVRDQPHATAAAAAAAPTLEPLQEDLPGPAKPGSGLRMTSPQREGDREKLQQVRANVRRKKERWRSLSLQ